MTGLRRFHGFRRVGQSKANIVVFFSPNLFKVGLNTVNRIIALEIPDINKKMLTPKVSSPRIKPMNIESVPTYNMKETV